MQEFLIMLKNVIIFVLLAIPGYVAVKSKLFKKEDSNIVSKLTLYIAVPFFIAASTLNINLTGEMAVQLIITGVVYSAFTVLLFILAKLFVRKSALAGLERFCVIFSNNGFIGLPLAEVIFIGNPIGATVIAHIVVVNVINNVLLMVLGPYMFTGDKSTISFKGIVKSPVLIAFILALIVNLIGVKEITSEALYYTTFIKNMVTPLAMTVLGMKFADVKVSELFGCKKLYYISLLKLIVFPVIIIGILLIVNIFTPVGEVIIYTMFIGFGTSTASLTTSLADRFNTGVKEASIYVLGTTIFSVITLSVLYALLCMVI